MVTLFKIAGQTSTLIASAQYTWIALLFLAVIGVIDPPDGAFLEGLLVTVGFGLLYWFREDVRFQLQMLIAESSSDEDVQAILDLVKGETERDDQLEEAWENERQS